EDPERDDDAALPRVGYRDPPEPIQQAPRVAVLVEAEPLPNEAHDPFPRRKLGHRLQRAERFDDPGELVDPQLARIACRALVMLDQRDQLAERASGQALGGREDQRLAPDPAFELGRKSGADVGEPDDAVPLAARLGRFLRRAQALRARRGGSQYLVVGPGLTAADGGETGERENDQPPRHALAAAMRAAISAPSCRSFASAYIAMSSA